MAKNTGEAWTKQDIVDLVKFFGWMDTLHHKSGPPEWPDANADRNLIILITDFERKSPS